MVLPALAGLAGSLGSLGGLAAQGSTLATLVTRLGAATVAINTAGKLIKNAGENLSKALVDITKVDQRLSVVNLELQSLLEGNTQALEDTTGGLAQASKALTELRILGFKDANKNIVDLATRLKLSGQNTEAFFKLTQSLLGIGGLTEDAIGDLSNRISSLAVTFNTTADSIVGAVASLTKNLSDLRVTGGVESVTNITATLAASLGPELATQVGDFLAQLTSASADLNQVARLGIEDLVDKLVTGADISDPIQFVSDLINTANNSARSIIGEAGEVTQRQFQAVRSTVGDLGVVSISLKESLDAQLQSADFGKGTGDRISELLGVFKENLLAPFNQAVANLQPSFEFLLKGLAVFTTSILNFISAFAPIIAGVSRVVGVVLGVIGVIINLVSSFVDSIIGTIGFLFGFGDGPSFSSYGKVFETLTGTGESNLKKTEEIRQSSLSIANINQNQTQLLESMRVSMARDSDNLETIGTAAEAGERRQLLEKIRETKDLTQFSRQNLVVVDRLARSLELQSMTDLVSISAESLEYHRRTADHTGKAIPAPPTPGAARR